MRILINNTLIAISILCALFFVGCTGTSDKLNRVSLGMTKPEVIKTIGEPDSISAAGDTEFLIYDWGSPKELVGTPKEYFVRLKAGKVDAFGKKGDFDSTKDPTINVNLKNQ
jgi:hypothetical protein